MEDKEKISITWSNILVKYSEINTSTISFLKEEGFFCILTGIYQPVKKVWGEITLLYIGQSFSKNLREKIIDSFENNDCIAKFVSEKERRTALIIGGKITKNSVKLESEDLYKDIVNCLINANKPLCNSSYRVISNAKIIEITNSGFYFPLKINFGGIQGTLKPLKNIYKKRHQLFVPMPGLIDK
jgi:hypothetical protein